MHDYLTMGLNMSDLRNLDILICNDCSCYKIKVKNSFIKLKISNLKKSISYWNT